MKIIERCGEINDNNKNCYIGKDKKARWKPQNVKNSKSIGNIIANKLAGHISSAKHHRNHK